MEYIEIDKGVIKGHFCSQVLPPGNNFKEVKDFTGCDGQSVDCFNWDKKGEIFPVEILIERGLVKDFKGLYYDKKTKEEFEIKELNEEPKENWTSLKPNERDFFQQWDYVEEKWIINLIEKQRASLSQSITEEENFLRSTDWYIIRKLELGTDVPIEITEQRQVARNTISSKRIELEKIS